MGFIKLKTNSDIVSMGVCELLHGLRTREFTAPEVVAAFSHMINNDKLNAVTVATLDMARESAIEADVNIKSGNIRTLEGIPYLSKSLFCIKGVVTDACSRMLEGFVPPYNATVISKLKDAGAILLGQSNMDEFAMGSTTLNSCYGPTINPWRSDADAIQDLNPGGSSGGSAAAVASSLAPFALGSDTGGSVRQPASLCGVVGFKPTYGLCSRFGMIAFASSLDQAGVFTSNVRDAALLLSVMGGHDRNDSTSLPIDIPDYASMITGDVRGMRIGIPREYRGEGLNDDVANAWDATAQLLRDRGASIVDVSLPHAKHAIPTYYLVACSEASSNLARYDGIRYGRTVPNKESMTAEEYYTAVRSQYFGKEVKRRIMLGNYVLSKVECDGVSCLYEVGYKVRALIYKEFRQIFESVDACLLPSANGGAYPLNTKLSTMEVYYSDIFTVPVNLCGCPAISVPVCLDKNGLPLGMQLMGPRLSEATLFQIAAAIEDAVEFKLPRPVVG